MTAVALRVHSALQLLFLDRSAVACCQVAEGTLKDAMVKAHLPVLPAGKVRARR